MSRQLNRFTWLLIILLIIGGVVADAHYAQVDVALRAAAGIVLAIVLLIMAYFTTQGQRAWVFIKGSRSELRKVVWPTRQETIQTTLVVAAMVVITALILWGVDAFFMWLVGWLTGQRG